MRRTGPAPMLLWLLTLGGGLLPLHAQRQDRLVLDLGYRWQPFFRGSSDLYRSQLDLGEGPRVFGGDLRLLRSRAWADRLSLGFSGWGGEPHNTARLRAIKSDAYDLRFDYQNVAYFHSLPAFANPLLDQGNLLSQSRYDISRRSTRLELELLPGRRLSPFLRFGYSGERGPVRTAFSEGGDEFPVDADLDTDSYDLGFGTRLELPRISLFLEQGFRWYRDRTSWESAGFQEGNSSRPLLGRDVSLETYSARNQVAGTIPFSSVTAAYRPTDGLQLRGKVSYSQAELDPAFSERGAGSFYSFSLRSFYGGLETATVGTVKQPNLLVDLLAQWQPHDRLRVLERLRLRRRQVSGALASRTTLLGLEPLLRSGVDARREIDSLFDTFLAVDQDHQQIEARFRVVPSLVLRAGHRWERRVVQLPERLRQEGNVLLLGLSYRPARRSRLVLDYELGRRDDPVFRADPVDSSRFKLGGGFSPFAGLEIDGSLSVRDHRDLLEGVDLTSRQRSLSLQARYDPGGRVSLSAHYLRRNTENDILIIVPQTFRVDRSRYRQEGDYAGLVFSLQLPRQASLRLGYSVWGAVGDFPFNRHQPQLRLELPLGENLLGYGQWDYHGYNEKLELFPQDYRTHLLVLGLRATFDLP